jgi:multidrug efflux pump subunit AcrA (membrane-fusion protein)
VEQLLRDGAASQRSLEEAQAELGLAQAAARAVGGGRADEAIPIVSPQDGVLSAVHVGVGQTVSGGAALFQVDAKGTLWIRVPVYSGDLREIAPGRAATVSVLGSASTETLVATPTTGPPTANADAASTDLYFVLEGNQSDLRPGQKVAVSLPLTTSQESLVVPWSAVLHDLNGGTWVYENTAPNVYARRRIEVAHVVGGFAVLTKGPAVGAKVVSVGAIEIFGTEFGTGK